MKEGNEFPKRSFASYIDKKQRQRFWHIKYIIVFTAVALVFFGVIAVFCRLNKTDKPVDGGYVIDSDYTFDDIPSYSGEPYCVLNNNIPMFQETNTTEAFEMYSNLDSLGRCGTAYANICKELMPTEERGEIGQVTPSGWNQEKYPGIVDSNPPYLFNRCHLIGYQLSGENANENNLITGTRYFNVQGMLPFENKVREYIDQNPKNHVLYRVTPIYKEKELVARGVVMEAWSVEDSGQEICFNVFVFNIQPGIEINYEDGSSWEQ